MRTDPYQPAAEVRPVEDLAAMAAEINMEHTAGERANLKRLAHYRRAGECLLRAQNQCRREGQPWLAWLKQNIRLSQQQCNKYMRWAELLSESNLPQDQWQEAWRKIAGHRDNAPVPPPQQEPDEYAEYAEAAMMIRQSHERICQGERERVEGFRCMGELLVMARGQLPEEHAWLKWLREDVGLPPRTAQACIEIYHGWDKCLTVRHLGVAGVLEYLRTGRVPEEEDAGESVGEVG